MPAPLKYWDLRLVLRGAGGFVSRQIREITGIIMGVLARSILTRSS